MRSNGGAQVDGVTQLFQQSLRQILLLRLLQLFVGSFCLTGMPGCSLTEDQALVQGTVSYRGRPLDHGSLRFFGSDQRPISCVIQHDGSYAIRLPAGNFRVSVTSPPQRPPHSDPQDDTPPPPDRNAFPARYSQISRSALRLSVSLPSEPRRWDIDLK